MALSKRTKWMVLAGLTGAGLGILGLRFDRISFDTKAFLASVESQDWRWLLAAVILIYGTYLGRAFRWAVLLRPVKPSPNMRNVLVGTVIGFTALTLFGRAGELVRPYLIARKEKVTVSSQLAALVLERIYDLLMSLGIFGAALALVRNSDMVVGPKLAWVLRYGGELVAVSAAILLILLLALRHFAETARRRLLEALTFLPPERYDRAAHLVNAFVQGVESARSDGALMLLALYSALEWALVAACYWCIARAHGPGVAMSMLDVVIFMGFTTFGAIVQIPGVGGGIQVVAVLVLTELFGIKLELAASMALMIWIISFVVIVPVGMMTALHEGLSWRGLKHVPVEIDV